MKSLVFLLAAGIALASCAHHDADVPAEPRTGAGAAIDGEAAYNEHCAGCHETGVLGAPREGEPDDWQNRSSLWQGVLMEHARTGYFDMPARGGKPRLPDDVVDAAAEYMLETTFPDRQED